MNGSRRSQTDPPEQAEEQPFIKITGNGNKAGSSVVHRSIQSNIPNPANLDQHELNLYGTNGSDKKD